MRISVLVVVLGLVGTLAAATDQPEPATIQLAQISGDPKEPRRHFRVRDPADLDAAEAEAVYRELKDDMAGIYALSGDAIAAAYQDWPRYSSVPYLSKTHGQRYVSNYGNRLAADYGRFEDAGAFPVGAVLAKDSFAATAAGAIFPGPLFLMEKMQPGFSNASGDWRYTMIMPDGAIFGMTKGEGAERVEYCIGCHLARERYDHLYFPPEGYRRAP